jgi:hypothetical protein
VPAPSPNLERADLKDAAFRLTPEAPVAPAVYRVNGSTVTPCWRPGASRRGQVDSDKKMRDRVQQRAESPSQRSSTSLRWAQIEYGHNFQRSSSL